MKLLEPLKVGSITLKNRIMFPPLTTGYEERDGSIGPKSLNFYKRLAQGGVGYIVIGDVVPVATLSPTPKLFTDAHVPSFRALAEACHEFGCKLGLQIFHPEYDTEALMNMMREGKSREEIFARLHYDMAHFINEASEEKLNTILARIQNSVEKAIEAGVDVIEVHGDRLVGSLCSTILNHRNDQYGGSFENRIRFALAVVDTIKKSSKPITIDYKLPIVTVQKDGTVIGKGGLFLDEAIKLAKLLEAHGVDMIHVAQANHTGNMNDTIPAMGTRDYAFMKEECKAIKEVVSVPVSTVGRIVSVEAAEQLLEESVCDFIGFGRPLLADPDIAVKLESGKKDLIRKCMMCNKGCTDAIMSSRFISCVLNAENGYEYERVITPAASKKRIAVVGGGIAGLEAARVAAIKGHDVTVFEASDRLFGQLNVASLPPRKDEMRRAYDVYEASIKEYAIKVCLGKTFAKDDAEGFDDVIVAVGAKNSAPRIPGIENSLDAWEVLEDPSLAKGSVLIAGGGLVGCETAELLAEKGMKVGIVEMLDGIAKEESKTILPTMMKSFTDHDVRIYTLHKITEIKANGIEADVVDKDGAVVSHVFLEANTVIRALSSRKQQLDLEGVKANVHYVGDCAPGLPCTVENAVKTGYDTANAI